MQRVEQVEYLIVHHSERTYDFPAFIRARHKLLRGWQDTGYHFLIGNGKFLTRDGKVYAGRPESEEGAHAYGYNHNSLGICLIGNFDKEIISERQFQALCRLLEQKQEQYHIPLENILGHNELPNTDKTCPGQQLNMTFVREMIRHSAGYPREIKRGLETEIWS